MIRLIIDTYEKPFSNLFKQPANDLANIKTQRLSDPSTVIIGHPNINSVRNKYEMFAEFIENFNIFLISKPKLGDTFQISSFIYKVLRFSDMTVTGTEVV